MDPYKITFESWNKVADAYNDKFMDLDMYNESYDLFCDAIGNENAKIFEIGCGPGNITKYLISKHPGYKIKAVDIAPAMVEIARKNNPEVTIEVKDARAIDKNDGTYDGIMCGFCIPYLSKDDCIALIKNCSSMLNARGVLYLSCIEGEYIKSGFESGSDPDIRMFVYYYDEGFLTEVIEQNQLSVSIVKRIPYKRNKSEILTQLILIVKKK